jgi:hypothetical protein
MLGVFQKSNLRIEIDASESKIRESLLRTELLRSWLLSQTVPTGLPEYLSAGTVFVSWIGAISIRHEVQSVTSNALCLLLSQGIDGFHQWHWGEGWVQSCLEGVSILPINLGQTASLMRLREFLTHSQM